MTNRLIAGIIMGNEADEFLEPVLKDIASYTDDMVIIDDATTDGSTDIAKQFTDNVYRKDKPTFHTNEHQLRKDLFKKYFPRYARKGDWVLHIDCDEMLDPRFKRKKDEWLAMDYPTILDFTMLECWGNADMVRVDGTWNPITKASAMIMKWMPEVNYQFPETRYHVGRLPMNQPLLTMPTGLWVIHLGWASETKIKTKRKYYKENDADNPHAPMQRHYQSMYEEPTLIPLDTFLPGGIGLGGDVVNDCGTVVRK